MKNLTGKTLGRYRILEELGQGGMATVYKAFDPVSRQNVAVKVLRAVLAHDPDALKRFQREAKALARLGHPNIVKMFEALAEGVHPYIVMEYVVGESLQDLLGRGPLPIPTTVTFGTQICAALDYAHGTGIIHRDIKPSNIMIISGGQVKVMDFGIARVVGGTLVTTAGVSIGTAEYMSPEQAKGESLDHRTDIYSLGIVLYEMLTGYVPFTGKSPYATALKHLQEQPMPPRMLNAAIPAALEQIVLRALEKNREARYQTAADLGRELQLLRASQVTKPSARVIKKGAPPPKRRPGSAKILGNVVRAGRGQRPRTWLVLLAILLVVLLVLLAVYLSLIVRAG